MASSLPTKAQLVEWKRLAADAKPSPWRYDGYEDALVRDAEGSWLASFGSVGVDEHANAEFAAAAREAVPILLAEHDRFRKLLGALLEVAEADHATCSHEWGCSGSPGCRSCLVIDQAKEVLGG